MANKPPPTLHLNGILVLLGLICVAMLVTLNPLVIGLMYRMDPPQLTYVLICDAALIVCCASLVRCAVTGRQGFLLLAIGLLCGLPLALSAFEASDAYWRYVAARDRYESTRAVRLFVADPLMGWAHPANARIMDAQFKVSYVTDEYGRKAIPQPRTGGGPTMHFFGDSFTFGYGVANADTALNLIANHTGLRILNYAVVGSGVEQMYMRFRSAADQVKLGDLVVFSPLTEDLKRNLMVGKVYVCNHVMTFGVDVKTFPVLRNAHWQFPQIFDECNFIQSLFFHSKYPIGGTYKRTYERVMSIFLRSQFLNNADQIFSQANSLANVIGAKFALLFLVRPEECAASSLVVDISQLKSKSLSLLKYCPKTRAEALKLGYSDGHWNIEGNRWAARSIEDALLSWAPTKTGQ